MKRNSICINDEKSEDQSLKIKELNKVVAGKDKKIDDLNSAISNLTLENQNLQKKLIKAIDKIKVSIYLFIQQGNSIFSF